MDKSDIVGWSLGLNLEVNAISEHLRKPKKANKNMASRVRAVWIEWYPVRRFWMQFVRMSRVIGRMEFGFDGRER